MDDHIEKALNAHREADEREAMCAYLRGQLICNGHDTEVVMELPTWKDLIDYVVTIAGGRVFGVESFPSCVVPTTVGAMISMADACQTKQNDSPVASSGTTAPESANVRTVGLAQSVRDVYEGKARLIPRPPLKF